MLVKQLCVEISRRSANDYSELRSQCLTGTMVVFSLVTETRQNLFSSFKLRWEMISSVETKLYVTCQGSN